jgi:hypothetical protein
VLKAQVHKNGYRAVGIGPGDGTWKLLKVGRLVLEAFRGPSAGREMEHRNRKRDDDRLTNLRWATRLENLLNSSKVLESSSGGVRGVTKHSNGWLAYADIGKLKKGGKRMYLGVHSTIAAASAAVSSFKRREKR